MIENNQTKVLFQLCTEKEKFVKPAAGTIVFIKDTKELYLDETYYGLSTTDAATLTKAVTDIDKLNNEAGEHLKLTNGLANYVANLRKFADGAAVNSTEGPVLTTHNSGVLQGKDNVKAAIDALAAAVDTLTGHTWTAVTKPGNAGQFATSVTQGTDGSITVSYADVKSTDVKRDTTQQQSIAGATVEAALETLKNAADAAQNTADQNTSDITVIRGTGEGSISKAVSDAKEALIGTGEGVWGGDEAKTLTRLRELISVNAGQITALTNMDSEQTTKITNIINELRQIDDSEAGDFANTLLDKFLTLYGTPTDGNYDVNGGKQTTLQGIINAIETRITNVNNTLSGNLTSTIQGLDATQKDHLTVNDEVEGNNHVGVKVVETDGKLTEVKVVEKDIASAASLTNLTTEVGKLSEKVTNQGGQLTWTVIS